MADVFVTLRQRLPALTKAERRIADTVLADPTIVVESTVVRLAEVCDTSPASVARFCRSIGYEGYREFRVAVAAANGREEVARDLFKVADAEIGPADSALDVITKVAYQEVRAVEDTARHLDLQALDEVVDAIRAAERVDVFGSGASGITALDLHQKLSRIGVASSCSPDPHTALPSFALSGPASVAVCISHSGQTVEANQLLGLARRRGARTVAITNHPNAPLGASADLVLTTSARESRYRTGATASRIAQMALVDFLFVRLCQRDFTRAGELLQLTFDSVQDHRLDTDRAGSSSD